MYNFASQCETKSCSMNALIVCGRYPPHHAHRIPPLRRRLDDLRVPHDFQEAGKPADDTRRRPLSRPVHIRDVMDRYPAKTIVFLDADCEIVGTPDDLARLACIGGDVAFCARTSWHRSDKPIFAPRTRAMVLRPTIKARALLARWMEACAEAPAWAGDQETLILAIGRVPELSITLLGIEFCATGQDRYPLPVILYGEALQGTRKPGRLTGLISRTRQP